MSPPNPQAPDPAPRTDAGRVRITRKIRFSASHRYHVPGWSDERNREVFGPCNNPYGHGHNYELEVTVGGEVDPETGMVINLREIDEIVQREVISVFDHRHINHEVPGFESVVPTTENLALDIWRRLAGALRREHAALDRIRLLESPDLWVEFDGDGCPAADEESDGESDEKSDEGADEGAEG